jgi:hypothetical protein
MRDNDSPSPWQVDEVSQSVLQAQQLAALAQQARLLEFALEGNSDVAKRLGSDLKETIERAMEAETSEELSGACAALAAALGEVPSHGMHLSAVLSDMEVEGVLGVARMPVLTAVLSTSTA